MTTEMMTFAVTATRRDSSGSTVCSKNAELTIDTSMAGRLDALNPVELLLASLSACLIKGIERVAGTLGIEYESVDVSTTAHRPVDDARIEDINYVVRIETKADQKKLDLLHKNLMKFGTIYNTVKSGTRLSGEIRAI
ncbi:MAG: hypothetical protein RL142_393 [Actinomycetota bacterium]|jgi:uncharacterized OsmC-like protein